MTKSKVLWWFGLIVAVLTAIISYCSCTAGISVGRANTVQQTVTNHLDSTVTTFSLTPISR